MIVWCENIITVAGSEDAVFEFITNSKTKGFWPADRVNQEYVDPGRACYKFFTKNIPPIKWFNSLAKKNSDMEFVLRFEDPIGRYMGVMKGHDGTVSQQSITY